MQQSQEKKQTPSRKTSGIQPRLLQITRAFDVPVAELYRAFTTADALTIWWWPKNLYTDRVDLDFREGGRYFINMKGFDQGGGGMTGQFQKIEKNKLIAMTDQFADASGNPISAKEAKMPGDWPKEIYITVEFEAIDDSTSRFTLSQEGIPDEMQNDCIQGWSESFDKLENYLSGRKNHSVI